MKFTKKELKLIKELNLIQSEYFEVGDEICHYNNFKAGLHFFFTATEDDEETYSGKNGTYLIKQKTI